MTDNELLLKAAAALWEIDENLEERQRTFEPDEHAQLGRLINHTDMIPS